MTQIPEQIKNSSAIPAWSGFLYQGKIALYHVIRMLLTSPCQGYLLKIETLEDFVIHDNNGKALSLHQVKTLQSPYRSTYESALTQASKIETQICTKNTERWFHVSTKINDFSDKEENTTINQHKVRFYTYHDGNKFIETGRIDHILTDIINEYLTSNSMLNTKQLIEQKIAKLQMLMAARVNLAHHKNQHNNLNKFDAANDTPISFSEIADCLDYESINRDDTDVILFEFRKTLLNRTDEILSHLNNSDDNEIPDGDWDGIMRCRSMIGAMSIADLTKLYFSKKPCQNTISLDAFSTDTVDSYLEIIFRISGIKTSNNLPHYFNLKQGTYLPTTMSFTSLNKKSNIGNIVKNIEGYKNNPTIKDILYEYDNLVVNMNLEAFDLHGHQSPAGRLSDISDEKKDKITKMKNTRLISIDDAKSEINDN
ncbi:MAG: ABC-three component system protein [Turicibacter sp.]